MPEKNLNEDFIQQCCQIAFDYIFVNLRQKARLRPELSQKFSQL